MVMTRGYTRKLNAEEKLARAAIKVAPSTKCGQHMVVVSSSVRGRPRAEVSLHDCAKMFREPAAFYKVKKTVKAFENLVDCAKMFREPVAFYKVKKTVKVFENLVDCVKMFREPTAFYKVNKTVKVFENLVDCVKMFREPVAFYKVKKTVKVFENLVDCAKMFKVVVEHPNKGTTSCTVCGEKGHNKRSCPLKCMPCTDQTGRAYCFAGMSQGMAVKMTKVIGHPDDCE